MQNKFTFWGKEEFKKVFLILKEFKHTLDSSRVCLVWNTSQCCFTRLATIFLTCGSSLRFLASC